MAEPREGQPPAPENNPFRHFVGQVVIHIPGVKGREKAEVGIETNLTLQHLETQIEDKDPKVREEREKEKKRLIEGIVTNLVESPEGLDTPEAKKNRTWFQNMVGDVKEGRRSVVWVPTAGAIIFFTAAVAGYEFGIRHAKDIRELAHLAGEFKKTVSPPKA